MQVSGSCRSIAGNGEIRALQRLRCRMNRTAVHSSVDSSSFEMRGGVSIRALWCVVTLALTSVMALASAQSMPPDPGDDASPQLEEGGKTEASAPFYVEYEKRVRAGEQIAPLTSEMFGDTVSPYLGQTEFNVVDIDLPGNNALPVQLRRRFSISPLTKETRADPNGGIGNPYGGLGNWDVEVPYIYGTFDLTRKWSKRLPGYTGRCSTPFVPDVADGFEATEIWSGNKVHLPGQGEFGLMGLDSAYPPLHVQDDGQAHSWTTSRFDSFTCKPTANGAYGEGFVMTTAEGVTYTFDVYVERRYAAVRHTNAVGGSAPRLMIFLLASQVTDRHGNWVKYSYNCMTADCAGHPEKIESSDGRKITLTYNPADPRQLQKAEVVQSSPAETRTWRYAYEYDPQGYPQLTAVTLPDNSQWKYTYSNTDYLYVTFTEEPPSGQECVDQHRSSGGDFTLGIAHPSGSQGTFQFGLVRHQRNLPLSTPNCANGRYYVPPYVDTFSLISKEITETDNSSKTWGYSYGIGFCSQEICKTATSRVVQPDGSAIDSVFSTAVNATGGYATGGAAIEGQLLRTDYKVTANGQVLRSETHDYFTGPDVNGGPHTGQLFPSRYGVVYGPDDPASGSVRPLKSTTIKLLMPPETGGSYLGVTFTRTNDTFDQFARPLKVTSASGLGFTRTETTAYQDYPTKWVLGQIKSVTDQTTGLVSVLNTYDPNTANLLNVTEFGVSKRNMTYWPSNNLTIANGSAGTLRTVNDGLNTTTLGLLRRGIPLSVTYEDDSSQSATVSDFGEILSVIDENADKTEYQYDAIGRLKKIKYPIDELQTWFDTTIDYTRVETDEMGISGWHWRRTQTTGNAKKITYYDQRLRPVVTEEYDATNAQTRENTLRYVARQFDYANRETFVSYPSKEFIPTKGIRTLYDTIGRVREVTQDAEPELGPVRTKTEYFFPFTKKVTDPNGNWTMTKFKAYDTPSEDAPYEIKTSALTRTEISYDIFNKPLSVTRSGGAFGSQTRNYVYDAGQRLCKTIELESGATIQDYDAAGNLLWSTKGSNLTGNTCGDRNNVPQADRTYYDYDLRNRLLSSTFPAGTPSVIQTYWPDGALKTTSSNGATWTYDYNRRGLLTSESLTYNGQEFLLEWGYDANGSVSQLMYPDDSIVNFAPNALGQPTQAGSYATNATYFANGAMKGFTYGNGIVHSLSQNARQLPRQSKDVKSLAAAVTDLTYAYDKNANVKSITDGPSPNESRAMTYDGLNRLETANSAGMWGNASFTYDARVLPQ